jgi:hypothetical protein
VIRTSAAEIKQSGRQTMGVRLVNLTSGQSLVAIARNAESLVNGDLGDEDLDPDALDPNDLVSDEDGSAADLVGTNDPDAESNTEGSPADGGDESADQQDSAADEVDDDQ